MLTRKLLNDDEVIYSHELYTILQKKDAPLPKTRRDALFAMSNLWDRLIWVLQEDEEFLDDLIRSLNRGIYDKGGHEQIEPDGSNITDALDPWQMESGALWGRKTAALYDDLGYVDFEENTPELWLYPGCETLEEEPDFAYQLVDTFYSVF